MNQNMTVKELREALSQHDDDMPVITSRYHRRGVKLKEIDVVHKDNQRMEKVLLVYRGGFD